MTASELVNLIRAGIEKHGDRDICISTTNEDEVEIGVNQFMPVGFSADEVEGEVDLPFELRAKNGGAK